MSSVNTEHKSPFELFYHSKPELSHLRTFGCECFPHIPAKLWHKLQQTAKPCIFLGYSDKYKGYRCLDAEHNRIITSRHVKFNELSFPFSCNVPVPDPPPGDIYPYLLIPTSPASDFQVNSVKQYKPQDVCATQPTSRTPQPTGSSNSEVASSAEPVIPTVPHKQHPMVTRTKTGSLKPRQRLNLLHTDSLVDTYADPTNFKDAYKHSHWRQAMAAEFYALQQQGTWSLVPRPPHSSPL
ncbi:hypothetical protein KFK09_009149 [Dendrobium nobile]|uniref:Retroviral polymerase SH3-like domain-containing protein n=1 Tax=Dendrobium nobile TaxID=94219 RepID=A0A8T3BM21_DENNO|nr:hypothetical protein KFK09_009149 [Dendrobium nobile]